VSKQSIHDVTPAYLWAFWLSVENVLGRLGYDLHRLHAWICSSAVTKGSDINRTYSEVLHSTTPQYGTVCQLRLKTYLIRQWWTPP